MAENNNGFTQEYDDDIERAVLGILLSDPDADFYFVGRSLSLSEKDFYLPKHQLILKGIYEADAKGLRPTLDVVTNKLRERGELELAGGVEYIASLTDIHYSRFNLAGYTRSLKDYTLKRGVLGMLADIKTDISHRVDPRSIIEKTYETLFDLTDKDSFNDGFPADFKQTRLVLNRTIDDIDELYKGKNTLSGISSSFRNLDTMTRGFQPSEYTVIYGDPEIRFFTLSMAAHICVNQKIPAAYFSLEKPDVFLMKAVLALDTRVAVWKLHSGFLPPNDFRQVLDSSERMCEAPLYILDELSMNILDIWSEARRLMALDNIGIIFIDNLHLIHSENEKPNMYAQYMSISKFIKRLACELKIPIVALYPLDFNTNASGPTGLVDTDILGGIKRVADTFINLTVDKIDPRKAKLCLEMNRNGPLGTLNFEYNPSCLKFREVLEQTEPKDFFDYNECVQEYFEGGEYDRAIADFTEDVKRDLRYAGFSYINRGDTYRKKGDCDRAINDYSEAIRLDPTSADAYLGRGAAYQMINQYDKSIQDFTEAVRLHPNPAYGYYGRAYTYEMKGQYDEAIKDYTEIVRLLPNGIFGYCARGDVYLKRKEFDEAIKDFTEAVRLDPTYNFAWAYSGRGAAYGGKGQHDEAIKDFAEVIRLFPDYALGYFRSGVAYGEKDQYDEAIKYFNESIRLDPNYARAYIFRGAAYRQLGQKDRAREDLEKALGIDLDDEFAKGELEKLQGDEY